MAAPPLESVCQRFETARRRRAAWEGLWRDCFGYALPTRGHGLGQEFGRGVSFADSLFDATAADAVEQLAASLLAELTPPWSQWFGLKPGRDVPPDHRDAVAESLEDIAQRLHGHFERSNFAVEMHQCLLDLACVGTATLLLEEAPAGGNSAFQFTAVPTAEMFIEGDHNGVVRHQYRLTTVTLATLRRRFPESLGMLIAGGRLQMGEDSRLELVEAVLEDVAGYHYMAFLPASPPVESRPALLAEGRFERSPFITFRWMKGSGELYGRSPVMTALPDIKTANKVVELILKNASIAVTGIWLAEDDGVLNPANIRLTPGSIIPKAVGSAGLTPLQAPGRFDVSQLVLEDLRARIRHALLADRLGPVGGQRMTATEVIERSSEMSRLLGAIYGRLQAELLTPMLQRAIMILARRGEIPAIKLDGTAAEIAYRSPLARVQSLDEVRNATLWLETLGKVGGEAMATVDAQAVSRWFAERLGVPPELMRNPYEVLDALQEATDEDSDNE